MGLGQDPSSNHGMRLKLFFLIKITQKHEGKATVGHFRVAMPSGTRGRPVGCRGSTWGVIEEPQSHLAGASTVLRVCGIVPRGAAQDVGSVQSAEWWIPPLGSVTLFRNSQTMCARARQPGVGRMG